MGIVRKTINGIVWIYEESDYDQMGKANGTRFVLGTAGEKPLIFLCRNPSTAEPGKPDQAIRKVMALWDAHNTNNPADKYDSWIMLNIYPQRATDPNDLDNQCIPQRHSKNTEVITHVIKNVCPDDCSIVAAWGDLTGKRNFLIGCLNDIVRELQAISGKRITWYCLGETQKKHPKFPLWFLNANTPLQSFDINNYFNRIGVIRPMGMNGKHAGWQKAVPAQVSANNSSDSAYTDKKDGDQARQTFSQSIKSDPNSAWDYYNSGLAHINKKNHDKAIADFTYVIERDSDNASAYYNRGLAYINKNDYCQAIADFSQAIKLDPKYAAAYCLRGMAYKAKGDTANAEADYVAAKNLKY